MLSYAFDVLVNEIIRSIALSRQNPIGSVLLVFGSSASISSITVVVAVVRTVVKRVFLSSYLALLIALSRCVPLMAGRGDVPRPVRQSSLLA